MNYLIRTFLCVALCFSFFASAGQLYGQEVVYSISGFFDSDEIFGPTSLSGQFYVAEFVVDTSVVDTDPSPDRAEYPNAIVSATVEFESGFISEVDFSGGLVTIQRDLGGGGIFLQDASQDSTFLVFELDNPFETDALPTDPTLQFTASPDSLVILAEPSAGTLVSFSEVDLESPELSRAIVFAVVSSPTNSVLRGDCNLDGAVTFGDIPAMIDVLSGGPFLEEADCNADGSVNFLDISPFIDILSGGSSTTSS